MSTDPAVAAGHIIDVSRGAEFRVLPMAVGAGDGPQPAGTISFAEQQRRIGVAIAKISGSKRRKNIMSMLATGWLPWGIEWSDRDPVPCLPLVGRQYVMCCRHALKAMEAQDFVDAGLLESGPLDWAGRPTLVITDLGKAWLQRVW
jgi:hypothetical protein